MSTRTIPQFTLATAIAAADFVPFAPADGVTNNKRITFANFLRNAPDGSGAAPGLAFANESNSGFWRGGLNDVRLAIGGSDKYFFTGGHLDLGDSTKHLGWNTDTFLYREAANSLALRNGTNGNFFAIYGTYTDAANWERMYLQAANSGHYLYGDKAGTGVARFLQFGTSNVGRWRIGATDGHFLAVTDNTYDIGASGATRPRNVYVADTVFASKARPNSLWLGASSDARLNSGGDGILGLYNTAENSFNRLQFGGTTASFPSLKRNATGLDARLADDSDFAPLRGRLTAHAAAVSETITPNATLILHDSNGTAYKVPCVAA